MAPREGLVRMAKEPRALARIRSAHDPWVLSVEPGQGAVVLRIVERNALRKCAPAGGTSPRQNKVAPSAWCASRAARGLARAGPK